MVTLSFLLSSLRCFSIKSEAYRPYLSSYRFLILIIIAFFLLAPVSSVDPGASGFCVAAFLGDVLLLGAKADGCDVLLGAASDDLSEIMVL